MGVLTKLIAKILEYVYAPEMKFGQEIGNRQV